MKSEKEYEVVGDIRIKQTKKKKSKKKSSDTSLGTKIFVWIMFIAMFGSFIVPLVIYLANIISAS